MKAGLRTHISNFYCSSPAEHIALISAARHLVMLNKHISYSTIEDDFPRFDDERLLFINLLVIVTDDDDYDLCL